MEIEGTSKINTKIQEFICCQKGILNLGYLANSEKTLKVLDDNQDLVKQLADMLIQSQDNSKYYSTIIVNFDQLSQSLTDKRYNLVEDKTYENFIARNYQIVGINFNDGDDIQEVLDNRFTYNIDLIAFKVNYCISTTDIEIEEENKNIQQTEDQEKNLLTIGQNIKHFHDQQDDLIYLIDFDIQHNLISKNVDIKQIMHQLEMKLYNFCTQTLLKNDIPLENIIISLNLPMLNCKNTQQASRYMEESAFNSLIMLSHSLPPCLGGVVFTFDGILDINTFASYMNELNRFKVINYFPYTYMTHSNTFQYLAQHWKGQDKRYIATNDYFLRCSESFEAGLNGNYKIQFDQLVIGQIEFGDITFQS